MRNSVRSFHGLLPHPDLHSIWSDCHYLVGQFLAESQRNACQGGSRRHDGAHHDHPHVIHQRGSTEDILRQINRCLPGNVLRHGLRFVTGQVPQTKLL